VLFKKNGGWKPLPFKGVLKEGKAYEGIPLLRERLHLTGDEQDCEEGNVYDSCLKQAVIHFQKRHGLVAKGVIGRKTLLALNQPVEEKIKKYV